MIYTEAEILEIMYTYPGLREAWAKKCGIDANDDRCVYGWKKDFGIFAKGWSAALENSELSATSTNSDYAAALGAFEEFDSCGPHPFGNDQFKGWLRQRLNAAKARHCA